MKLFLGITTLSVLDYSCVEAPITSINERQFENNVANSYVSVPSLIRLWFKDGETTE